MARQHVAGIDIAKGEILLNSYSEPALLLDREYRIVGFNLAYQQLYSAAQTTIGRLCYEISHGNEKPCSAYGYPCPLEVVKQLGRSERALHIHETPEGKRYMDVEVLPVLAENGVVEHYIEIVRPISFASAFPVPVGLVGTSPAFRRIVEMILRVAPHPFPVLLEGETGTGKELVARAIHEASPRKHGPFVPVECSGLTENLFESELFGHKKGAFTGAYEQKAGLVETASGGTLFLDEVGEIPLREQVKLLRVIETLNFRRVGDTQPRLADFRLICATNQDLYAMLQRGAFRPDLYFRISAFPLHLAPLRERVEDIAPIAQAILSRVPGLETMLLDARVLDYLQSYLFPGNIRELQNMLERAALLTNDNTLRIEHFPHHDEDDGKNNPMPATGQPGAGGGDMDDLEILPLKEVERRYLSYALTKYPKDRAKLAKSLGISLRTLFRKLEGL